MSKNSNLDMFNDLTLQRLNELLRPLDVPKMRRDLNNLSNLRWLQRNLSIDNNDSDNINTIHLLIRTLIRRGHK
jgi:hypothetical protein